MKLGHIRNFFGNKEPLYLGLAFLATGVVFGSWITRIPDIKAALELSEADLGFALIGAPIGAILMMPICGWIIEKVGLGKTNMIASFLHLISPIILAHAWGFWSLAAGLFYFGLTEAILNVSINASVANVEKKLGRPIMSSCHGMWSLGGMVGAGLGSIFIGFSISPQDHLSVTSILMIIAIFSTKSVLLKVVDKKSPSQKVFALPDYEILGLAFIGFCILAAEGALADWSTLYMSDSLNASPFIVGFAYANFALFMTIGRFMGDGIIPFLGARTTVLIGALGSGFALSIALIFGNPILSIIMFGIVGLGYSCVVPVLFSSAGNSKTLSSGAGIAAVSTIGYFGFLGGPPSIGFVAELYSLTVGLSIVVALTFAAGIIAIRVKF